MNKHNSAGISLTFRGGGGGGREECVWSRPNILLRAFYWSVKMEYLGGLEKKRTVQKPSAKSVIGKPCC